DGSGAVSGGDVVGVHQASKGRGERRIELPVDAGVGVGRDRQEGLGDGQRPNTGHDEVVVQLATATVADVGCDVVGAYGAGRHGGRRVGDSDGVAVLNAIAADNAIEGWVSRAVGAGLV